MFTVSKFIQLKCTILSNAVSYPMAASFVATSYNRNDYLGNDWLPETLNFNPGVFVVTLRNRKHYLGNDYWLPEAF